MRYPLVRMRRLRENVFMRTLCAEVRVGADDLVYPIFVHAGKRAEEVRTMPGVSRHSLDSMLTEVEACARHGIPMVALFPAVDPALKSADAREAANPDGLIPTCLRHIADRFPDMGVMADVALDPYTDHGHDGLVNARGRVDNDATVALLVRQAIQLAQSGCCALAPSDMMDGRIGAIRAALEEQHRHEIVLIAYSAKYASAFYGPFRDAISAAHRLGTQAKRGYQMDPACARQAMREGALDVSEGSDALMVKPALPYLDIISAYRRQFDLPVFAYQVSGEYAMLKLAAAHGCGDEDSMVRESLVCIKRAGADCIVSYFALDWARAQAGRGGN